MPPLLKTCPKMVLSHKGGSLCVKDVFAKKFLVSGEIPLAARSHRFFGNTPVKAGPDAAEHYIRHCGVSPSGQGLGAPIQNDSGLPQGPARAFGGYSACGKRAQRGSGRSPCAT